MANEVNVDVSKYLAEKAAGTASLVRLNGVVRYTSRKFDPATGKPVPVLVPMDEAGLKTALGAAKAQVEVFTQLIEDFTKAEEKLA